MDVRILELISFALLLISGLSLERVIFGPSPEDRMIGLNLIVSQTVGIMAVIAVRFRREIYLDVALVYAILGFISIVAIAKYLRGKRLGE